MKVLLCGLFLFATTPVFSEHWEDVDTGDLVQIINGGIEQDGITVPEGTVLPIESKQTTNVGGEWLRVKYQDSWIYLWQTSQNTKWYILTEGNKDIIRSLGFTGGLGIVIVFALAWNSRTV